MASIKLSIRLLKASFDPKTSVRDGVQLKPWKNISGSFITLGNYGINTPEWATYIKLNDKDKSKVSVQYSYALIFMKYRDRWFSFSFGYGYTKLKPNSYEPDFGLRVVLNTVDPNQLKSTDSKTPDETTLSRRSQTSKGSDQTAFGIDYERDIVRGVSGKPTDSTIASNVSGSDALTINTQKQLSDINDICKFAFDSYKDTKYQSNFKWIDYIKYINDDSIINKLDDKLVESLQRSLDGNIESNLHLAYPVIYDPNNLVYIQYRGFYSNLIYTGMSIKEYIHALKNKGISNIDIGDINRHEIAEVDDTGKIVGNTWNLKSCISYDLLFKKHTYVLSSGQWFQIDKVFAKEVREFFDSSPRYKLPKAKSNENEVTYSERIINTEDNLIELGNSALHPDLAMSGIEVCDFLSRDKKLIHLKHQNKSAKLSHLFNQGTVSAQTLVLDENFRDKVRELIKKREKKFKKRGFVDLIPDSVNAFYPRDYTVVYGVIGQSKDARLPFFSLVTFRRAARDLKSQGYSCEFCWIEQPRKAIAKKKKKSSKSSGKK